MTDDPLSPEELQEAVDELIDDLMPEILPVLVKRLQDRGYGTDTGFKGLDEFREVVQSYLAIHEDLRLLEANTSVQFGQGAVFTAKFGVFTR